MGEIALSLAMLLRTSIDFVAPVASSFYACRSKTTTTSSLSLAGAPELNAGYEPAVSLAVDVATTRTENDPTRLDRVGEQLKRLTKQRLNERTQERARKRTKSVARKIVTRQQREKAIGSNSSEPCLALERTWRSGALRALHTFVQRSAGAILFSRAFRCVESDIVVGVALALALPSLASLESRLALVA